MQPDFETSDGFQSFEDYYRNGQMSRFEQEHRRGGSFGIGMILVEQEGGEFIDPAIDEFTVVGILNPAAKGEFDFGDGWTPAASYGTAFVGPQPARQECAFRLASRHKILAACANSSAVIAQFDRAGIRHDPFAPMYAHLAHSPVVMSLLKTMWSGMKTGGPTNHLLIYGCFIALLGHMLDENDQQSFAAVPDLNNGHLSKVIDYIEAHFDTPLLTSELAAIAAMSVAQFGRGFKAATGYSPHHYVTIRRVEHAKRKLCTGELTITQIAYCCGFSSAAHFATVFGKYVGATPSVYRAAVQ